MTKLKVLVSDAVADVCVAHLEQQDFEVRYSPGLPAKELENTIEDYHALIVRSATKVTAGVIERGRNLRVIGRAGTGVDNIDVAAATQKGIAVVNSPGGNTLSAAEHTFAMMIALARQIPAAHLSMLAGKWQRSAFTGVELYGKKLGIVGLGQIGREVANRARAFGMTVVAYDPLISAADFQAAHVGQMEIDEMLEQCDFLTLHLPLNEQTRHLFSDRQFETCNPNLRIINVARGGVIDEDALCRAVKAGKIAGAALDVFEKEPPGMSPLLGLSNVITTPHLGASTVDAQRRVAAEIAGSVADYLLGRKVESIVNSEGLGVERWREF
ncbi:MAG: hydroxyacid dehydrogenase [bacterium]